MVAVTVLWQTDLPPAAPFPDGYDLQGDDNQGFDWTRGVRYQAIDASGLGGVEVTDLATMDVTELVTYDSMYLGTPYGVPAGSPPSQVCIGLTCGNNSDLYLVLKTGITPLGSRLARVDPATWKVTGEFYTSSTLTGSVYGAGIECVNVAGGSTIVGSNGNYVFDKAQLFDGSSMAFLWYGAPATYPGIINKILIPGAQSGSGSCEFWVINSDISGTSGNIDFWKISVDAGLAVSEMLAFTLAYNPGSHVYVQRAEWDDAHGRFLVWIAASPSAAPTLISLGTTGTIAWTYTGGALAREVQGGHGNSNFTGASMGVISSVGHVTLINTNTGSVIQPNALTADNSIPPNSNNPALTVSFYDAWDGTDRVFYTRYLGVGPLAISWGAPPVGVSIAMDNVVVSSLLTESPCTSALFAAGFETVGSVLGLRWSDTRGADFENPIPVEFSSDSEWQPIWRRTGMARDRVFELFWSAAVDTALNGAFVTVDPLKS